MSEPVIQLWNVRKSYGVFRRSEALRGVSICVRRGECYGLAGPNGAGKTTLIRLLLGLAMPDEGEVRLLGERPDDPRVRARVGFVPESAELPPAASPRDLVRRFARLRGLPREAAAAGLQQLDRLGVSELLDRPAGKLSKGEKQRTLLALALLGDPELLVLDEPTDGLDPIGRALVRRVLREELARGRTVFLNSHLLSETERVCTRVGILHRGQLVREQAISAPAADGAGPSAVTLAGGETKLVEHADFAALNTHLDTLRAGGALISEVQRVGRDLEASLEQAVTGPGVVPPDPGPRPPEAPPARVQPLRAARATVRVAQEIAADLASRKVGWFGLGLAVLVLALFFWGLRNDIVGGAAAAVRQFGGPGGVADATTVAHFVGRWSASFVYWALLPGTLVFASLFAPPLLDPRRTVLLLAQPVSRGDLACALYATVCLATLAEYAFLVGLFFGGMRWLGVAVSPLFLALAAPLVLAFASLYAVSLAAAYGLRSGVASGGIAFGLFLAAVLSQAEMRAGGAPLRQIIGGTVLPRVVALGEQAARLGGGEAPRFAPFALTAAMATALFIVAFVIARRSEQ